MMKAKTKGHWTRGKRRHPEGAAVVKSLRRFIRHEDAIQAEVARSIGVSHKTLWRWLTDNHWPGQPHARRIQAFLARPNSDVKR